ncbi:MAG: septal ring lytic transglycosylase RlpA family protein [Alphaproteobacteria bacterium]
MRLRLCLYLALMAVLAGCATTTHHPARNAGTYRVGQPYQVAGTWYYPKEQPNYDEVGLASWYGPGFHGHLTADGEVYDQRSLTAAHATLPLPVNVRVTNLDNGRSIVLRVNDRGPFHPGRIIDVSQRAAELLGFREAGTARVRVEYLSRADGQPYTMMASSSKPPATSPAPARPSANAPVIASMAPIPDPPASAANSPSQMPADAGNAPQLRAPIISSQGAKPAPESSGLAQAHVAAGDLPSDSDFASEGSVASTASSVDVASAPPAASADLDPPVPSGQLYVQVGAFSDAHNAMQLYNEVLGFGKASISPLAANGQTIYRVRLGPVADADEASRVTSKLKAHGHDGAKIVMQ